MRRRLLAWAATLAAAAGLLGLGLSRVTVDADVTSVLPRSDPLVNDVRMVYREVPALERIYVDVSVGAADRGALRQAARHVARRLGESGLFRSVGLPRAADAFARLYADLPERLPLLFDREALSQQVAPRLEADWLRRHFRALRERLTGLEGVGLAKLITRDPLSLRDLVMARLARLRPSDRATLDGDLPISADGRHALVIAVPRRPGADTAQARRVLALLDEIAAALRGRPETRGARLVAAGGFRAALDNERIIRRDAERSVLLATLGVLLLVLLAFPRPLLGLLALVPAAAGAVVSLAVYSLFASRISALALGFGGAIVSLTVDHGLVYLLFYGDGRGAAARRASEKLWSVGLLPALTTVAAFLVLPLSGFPLLAQVGLFAGVGVAAAFLFCHLVMPWLLAPAGRGGAGRGPTATDAPHPVAAAAGGLRRGRPRHGLPTARLVPRALLRLGRLGWVAPALVVATSVLLAALARPRFALDVRAMNAVSADTLRAEAHFRKVWGPLDQQVLLVHRAPNLRRAVAGSDRLARMLSGARRAGLLAGGFSPSELFPGPALAQAQRAAWRAFWTPERRARLRAALAAAAREVGFDPRAFAPFLATLQPAARVPAAGPPPRDLWPVLGLVARSAGKGFLVVTPARRGPRYDAAALDVRAGALGVRAVDLDRFSARLSGLLASSFAWMLLLVGIGVLCLVSLLLLDVALIGLSLAPLALAVGGTLGVLSALGRPLDLAAILLAIVVFGTGLDYGLYVVRSFQWDPQERPAVHGPVRVGVLLAGGSTLVGFASLALSRHPVLQSVGLTVSVGLGFALLGALVLLPPVARRLMARRGSAGGASSAAPAEATSTPGSRAHRRAVSRRYRHLEPYPRLFAWFKLRLDPLFASLADRLPEAGLVVDVGAGFGVPAAFLQTLRPRLRVVALEPLAGRARVAALALDRPVHVLRARAPGLPVRAGCAQAVLMIDMAHYLEDGALQRALREARGLLAPGGRLLLRATVPQDGRVPLPRRIEGLRLGRAGLRAHYRSAAQIEAALRRAGFDRVAVQPEPGGREETWLQAEVAPRGKAADGAPPAPGAPQEGP